MSLPKQTEIICPHCGTRYSATVYDSLNTNYQRNVAESIINGSRFDAVCPHCKFTVHLNYNMLYNDIKHDAWVWVINKEEGYEDHIREVRSCATATTGTQTMKISRIVNSISELREKVLCFETGKDDRVIELMKCISWSQLQEMKPGFDMERLVLIRRNGDLYFNVYGQENGKNQTVTIQYDPGLYENLKKLFHKELNVPLKPFEIVDEEWAFEQLKKASEEGRLGEAAQEAAASSEAVDQDTSINNENTAKEEEPVAPQIANTAHNASSAPSSAGPAMRAPDKITTNQLPAVEPEKNDSKKRHGLWWVLAGVLCLAFIAAAFFVGRKSGIKKAENTQALMTSAITFDKQIIDLPVGYAYDPEIQVLPETAKNKYYELHTSNEAVVEIQYGIMHGRSAGTAVITAVQNGVEYGYCVINVTDKQPTRINFISDFQNCKVGRTEDISLAFYPDDVTNKEVSYILSDDTLASIEGNEVRFKAAGTLTIMAKHPATGLTCSATVEITPVELNNITIDMEHTIGVGRSDPLQVRLFPEDATETPLEWSVKNKSVATIEDGKLVAKKIGKTQLTVEDTVKGLTDTIEIEVIPIEAVSITLSGNTTMVAGDSAMLQVSFKPADTTDTTVVWSSTNNGIATVSKGKVTAKNPGTCAITATAKNGVTASIPITVKPKPVKIVNGFVKKPSGQKVCPVKVNAPNDAAVYVYFKCTYDSSYDFSMLVERGSSCEVKAPIAYYEAYYASGTEWYGKEYKFGDDTHYYKCDSNFLFYTEDSRAYGTELTLYAVRNGNMSTKAISEGSFPD